MLHPSYKLAYFRERKWRQTWIDRARDLVATEYEDHYANKSIADPNLHDGARSDGGDEHEDEDNNSQEEQDDDHDADQEEEQRWLTGGGSSSPAGTTCMVRARTSSAFCVVRGTSAGDDADLAGTSCQVSDQLAPGQ